MGTLNSILATLQYATQPSVILRDYQHAAKVFGPDSSGKLPKTKNWFYIYFQIDATVAQSIAKNFKAIGASPYINWHQSANGIATLGIYTRSVKLPNFKFQVNKKNQYNRWSLTTTKIEYDPIDVSFWDDGLSIINSFWYAYYSYMIQDPGYTNWAGNFEINPTANWQPSSGNVSALYNGSDQWANYGLDTIDAQGTNPNFNRTIPFFNSIRIYQFNRAHAKNSSTPTKNTGASYNEFVLVNPIITSFAHDSLDSADSGFMTNKMSIEYETVLYNSGTLSTAIGESGVPAWDAVQHIIDTTPSPLAKPNKIINTISNAVNTVEGGLAVASEIQNNPGGISVLTVLSQAAASATVIDSAASIASSNSPIIAVPVFNNPTVNSQFGGGGLPPATQGS